MKFQPMLVNTLAGSTSAVAEQAKSPLFPARMLAPIWKSEVSVAAKKALPLGAELSVMVDRPTATELWYASAPPPAELAEFQVTVDVTSSTAASYA
jgi:hypothetical protein